jgi:hypothetical protein
VSETRDAPSGTWRVMDRGQRTFAFVEGETFPDARAAVQQRPDLRTIAERGFYLRRLRESEVTAREQWAEARHPGAESGPRDDTAEGDYEDAVPDEQDDEAGAIANALDTLVKLGAAEVATEKPRRFRRATQPAEAAPEADNADGAKQDGTDLAGAA